MALHPDIMISNRYDIRDGVMQPCHNESGLTQHYVESENVEFENVQYEHERAGMGVSARTSRHNGRVNATDRGKIPVRMGLVQTVIAMPVWVRAFNVSPQSLPPQSLPPQSAP